MEEIQALVREGQMVLLEYYTTAAATYLWLLDGKNIHAYAIGIGNPDGTLPFSKIEVQQLQRLYPGDTEIFTGKQATEYRIKEKYAELPDILHFSCHGSFNAGYPLYSALHLGKNEIDDGRLEVHEIFQLNLKPAYLVTLSACETHLGGIRPGDEIIGMSRAFIYAGTPSILASLWKVDDYYTSKLMVAFYRSLKQNDKLDALQAARKTMIEDYGKRHPYYWSGFVLIGDYR